jgi:hypothetical protein
MAKRPTNKQNWQGRQVTSFGPKFRIDVANPQMGINGTDVYTLYGVTDGKDVCITGLTEGGLYKIYNDKSVEIVAGQKSSGGVDIMITGRNGDICITAEKSGRVRIRAQNITLDADEDIDIVAGRNINVLSGSGRVFLKGTTVASDGIDGNLVPKGATFGEIAFAGTYVGGDKVSSAFNGGVASNVQSASDTSKSCDPNIDSPAATENSKYADDVLSDAELNRANVTTSANVVSTGGAATGGTLAE